MKLHKTGEGEHEFFISQIFIFLGLLKIEVFQGPTPLTQAVGRKGWKKPQNPEKAVEGVMLAANRLLLRDSIKEHNCLFWRAGSDTADVTSFATIRQRKSWENPTK